MSRRFHHECGCVEIIWLGEYVELIRCERHRTVHEAIERGAKERNEACAVEALIAQGRKR